MTESEMRRRAIALYDAFTHVHHDRRAFMAALTRLAGSAAAAELLLGGLAPDPAAALQVPEDDSRLSAQYVTASEPGSRETRGYFVQQKAAVRAPGIVVIHENRGLTPHIRDIARRLALEGFAAFAPDLLSPAGGTPADEDAARTMTATLDLAGAALDVVGVMRWLTRERRTSGAVGVMGFCWGGAMANRVAIVAGQTLRAGIAYYGPAPAPAEASRVVAPLLLHYAGLDTRVNKSGEAWVKALQRAGKSVTAYFYPGVNHAFNNDTSADRYDAAAARLAWDRSMAFLNQQLA